MKLDSLRELLLKKTNDSSMELLIGFIRDDILADLVIESLEKMARSKTKGDHANVPIRDFGIEMDPETEPKMLHDALSHHVSHYKAALNGGNRDVANQHAKQIFRLMDMGDKTQQHSQGKLNIEAVSPHAWERHHKSETFKDRIDSIQGRLNSGEHVSDSEKEWLNDNPVTRGSKRPEHFINDTKGWNYRGKDYSFLQHAPHEAFRDEIRRHGHNKAYPLEHIKINGQHVDVHDVPSEEASSYKEHPFDHHPIMRHFEEPASKRSPEKDAAWRKEHGEYATSKHVDDYFDKQAKMEEADPDKHAKRGLSPSAPVHADVEGLDVSKDVGSKTKQTPTPSQPTPNVIRRPVTTAPGEQSNSKSVDDHIKTVQATDLPDHIKASIIRSLKGG